MRLAFAYVPNGITMKEWTPATAGADFEFTRILKPLEPLRKDMLVLSRAWRITTRLARRRSAATTRAPAPAS